MVNYGGFKSTAFFRLGTESTRTLTRLWHHACGLNLLSKKRTECGGGPLRGVQKKKVNPMRSLFT